ncbi:alpha/beta hydrolase [Nonomuraea muscovyensis]|uniref:alpha/beta hydrolase n=1 Tax=Nonomuraea muscovyensis TaxID=1124761 RepID=UPI0034028A45
MAPRPRDASRAPLPPTAHPTAPEGPSQEGRTTGDQPPGGPAGRGRSRGGEPGRGAARPGRLRRALLCVLVTASVVVPVSGAAKPPAVPAPVPAPVRPLRTATPAALAERYAASRAAIADAERMAAEHGHLRRAGSLRAMAGPSRALLSFDGRDGGRTVEVFGDLARAGRIAVLVPGTDTDLDRYGRLHGGAASLQRELRERGGDGASVVVAWLGYRTPSLFGPEVLTSGRAAEAAPGLRRFVRELRALRPAARISLVCHSYGSVVCARVASEPGVSDVVLYGSPGTGVDHVAGLGTRATVWTGRATGDWVSAVPHTRVRLPFTTLGFGTDPVSPEFGARVFAAGDGGHSDYLRPGSVALENVARIILEAPPVAAGHRG